MKRFEEIASSRSGKIEDGYQRNYSAKKTEQVKYKHPENEVFIHIHEDGRDCEDSYRNEFVKIGQQTIEYRYDIGNYFVTEDIYLYSNNEKIAHASREYGAVDPEKTEVSNKEAAIEFLMGLSKPFGLSTTDFVYSCCSQFRISKECFAVFLK